MKWTVIFINLSALFCLLLSLIKDKEKTIFSLKIAAKSFFRILPIIFIIIAFPMATALIKKGARLSNIIVFLSAWACIKIPQEMVELQFLGLNFMASRLILTIVFISIMALCIEQIIEWNKKSEKKL